MSTCIIKRKLIIFLSYINTRCGKEKDDVEERYSFGIYAGRMCAKCAYDSYRDHCGLIKTKDGWYVEEGEQGAVEDLAEFEYGGYDAIDGEGT